MHDGSWSCIGLLVQCCMFFFFSRIASAFWVYRHQTMVRWVGVRETVAVSASRSKLWKLLKDSGEPLGPGVTVEPPLMFKLPKLFSFKQPYLDHVFVPVFMGELNTTCNMFSVGAPALHVCYGKITAGSWLHILSPWTATCYYLWLIKWEIMCFVPDEHLCLDVCVWVFDVFVLAPIQ